MRILKIVPDSRRKEQMLCSMYDIVGKEHMIYFSPTATRNEKKFIMQNVF